MSVGKEMCARNSLANHPILTRMPIMVSVTTDTVARVHSHLSTHQYEGLIKKATLKVGSGS